MKNLHLKGRWVLITGASSGLGKSMAYRLAAEYGANLILVARRIERLDAIATELAQKYSIQCKSIQADMTKMEDVDRLFSESIAEIELQAVILNAGVTYYGKHCDMEWQEYERMIATNLSSVMRLVHLYVPYFIKADNGGAIMMVSSMAGIIPVPFQAAYSGSKAFLNNFGQSLSVELKQENISITTYAPGGISTEMNEISGLNEVFADSPFLQTPDDCAKAALGAMIARKRFYVPGLMNQAQLLLTRLVPRGLVLNVLQQAYGRGVN